jgi:hypothetical protein
VAKVKIQVANGPRRCRNFRKLPTVFTQSNPGSMSFRFCWLTSARQKVDLVDYLSRRSSR